ncbi:Transcription intermediary factor 1-alpha [Collichthys lucidus]|uniref:Transcription intermediary factor 1-alpha n=1 Tax=Collichthys lucidus TaxID=240159 RepID=A0A4U5UHR7_COLLU|nr:Transcription intermediary factor 1-alpha [Collichthys lucidus]
MDGCTEMQETVDAAAAAVIIVENEAESMPVLEQKSPVTGQNHMDACPVCHLNFHSREPKLLPCLHSFCKRCLPPPSRNLAVTELPNSQVDRATRPLNVIRCPVCRQECMEVDVMENVFVKDTVEAPSSTMERTVQLCMTCDDNTEAAGFCVNCVEYLCGTCVEAHQRVKFTRDHNIRPTAELSQKVHGVSTQRPMFCDVHKQEPLKLFCETCDLLTCRDCQLVKHKDHNYQFLEDAYKNHKQHMENVTHQLEEKKKVIEEVSDSINNGYNLHVFPQIARFHVENGTCSLENNQATQTTSDNEKSSKCLCEYVLIFTLFVKSEHIEYMSLRLLQVDQNRSSVRGEIKKSICSLILEINKKGKMLINQLEAVTKDHESVLRKQQEDIGFLSRHLDHVINFTKWATARNGGTALLYCKRLILFQIGNLLQAKCSTSFVPQSTVRFQCRSSYWASNVDLGSLVVESVPGQQLGGVQGIPHQLPHHGQAPSGSPHSFALGAPHNTLAQLQMQVDKLNPQAHWQPQPPPPPWTWFMVLPPNNASPTSSLPSPGFTPQQWYVYAFHVVVGCMCCCILNKADFYFSQVQGQENSAEYAAVSQEEKPGTVSWKPPETHQTSGAVGSAVKKRRRSSPGPVIVIKDEPDDDGGYVQAYQRASLPDSTGDQPQITAQDDKPHGPSRPPSSPQDQSSSNHVRSLEEQQHRALLDDSNEALCAVCHTGGELLCCDKCLKHYALCTESLDWSLFSGEWFCSFCRDLLTPEMRYESKPDAKTVKKEPDTEGGFLPEDKQKCERLLLHLFCSDLSSDFQEPVSASVCANNRLTVKGPMKLSTVKKRLEAKQGPCYQSPAEFVSDIRLVFENYNSVSEVLKVDTKVTVAGRKLKELFEDHLRVIFPDQTFPEIKLETAPPDSQLSSLDNISQIAKRRRTCADLDQDTASCPGREEAAHIFFNHFDG